MKYEYNSYYYFRGLGKKIKYNYSKIILNKTLCTLDINK